MAYGKILLKKHKKEEKYMNVKLKTKQIYDEHEEIQEAFHENIEVNRLEEKIKKEEI